MPEIIDKYSCLHYSRRHYGSYYTERNSLRGNLAFLNTGLVCPQIYTACELGYGQGLSANLHAAASTAKW